MADSEITGHTRVYAHVAHPSSHVRTPQVFNAAFRERGLDVVTVSVDVAPADLHPMVQGMRGWRNLAGIGVTIPHKQAIVAELDETRGLASAVGSVNNIRREPDGRLVGVNTDGPGFVTSMRGAGREPAGRRALLVGVGGAGRAIAFSLVEAGVASLRLANRTESRAVELADEITAIFPSTPVDVGPAAAADHDLIVNATTLGMREGDDLPLDVDGLSEGVVVADIIMAPPRTRLMEEAERRGCIVHPGLLMLRAQIDLVIEFLGL